MRERRRNFSQGYKSNIFVGQASTIFIIIGLVFMFGVLYISGSNTLAAKTDTMSDLARKKDELTAEKERLEIEAARLQSIQEIKKSSQADSTKFVAVKKINYLSNSTSVAVK